MENGSDVVVEASGEGQDTIINTVSSYLLPAHVENLVLGGKLALTGTGNASANLMIGNAGANVLFGNDGDDTLNGGAGIDQLYGGKGNDTYVVDTALDQVVDFSGNDTVNASVSYVLGTDVENLYLVPGSKAQLDTGNALDNLVIGNAGKNTLNGAEGNDTLDGQSGLDVLTGGSGDDVFVFSTALAKNLDKITDFNAANDTIRLDNAVFTALGEGSLPAVAFQAAASSLAASTDARIIFNTATGALLYDADGLGGVVAVPFATLVIIGLVGPVTAADFVVT